MSLLSNGQLLIRHAPSADSAAFAMQVPFQLGDYQLEPLFRQPAINATAALTGTPSPAWSLAKPTTVVQQNPWDVAHHAAAQQGYRAYVEPDIINSPASPPLAVAAAGLNQNYPPSQPVSPGWHLGQDFAGFLNVRGVATGSGVRIAHLDTGYTPAHASTPRRMRPDLGWNFWDDNADTVDPGTEVAGLLQPGHGTATLAILAGGAVDLAFGGERFTGDFGGAPEAEVVPVRIGPSVIHFYASTMARGLHYALAPADNPAMKSHLVSLSHGGLPSAAWADAVNALYSAGVTVVAASGDFYRVLGVDLATQYTVYPSAFNRVTTAVGATYARTPYSTDKNGVLQGSWGPDSVMEKAVAGFTPNVAWMKRDLLPDGFDMNGGGTSASTPQVAAACALWLERFGSRFPQDWRVVEACRLALFDSCNAAQAGRRALGWGTLNVPAMLDEARADHIAATLAAGNLKQSAADAVSFPFWRELVGAGPPASAQEAMYETEVAQIVLASKNASLVKAAQAVASGQTLGQQDRAALVAALKTETISQPLRTRLD